ncbi:helix-turn-helix transcriptional regulator [Fodinicurvata sp. EGI_FJ10296]|uniref:helix-turn-helix domain-containing protein n=1 Tax=Fodinicurvata sp. EGI_FJ10296 TaxID=3231908 RepID=UPI00345387DA
MSKVRDLHRQWRHDPDYQAAYDALKPEFDLARSMIEARRQASLTQEQLAQLMGTTQSVIARLESGTTRPSTRTLEKLAQATRTRLTIRFEAAGDAR